jgi:hypothetical protein
MNNAFIYSEVPMYSSVLGWILQQSPSYESEYFVFNNSIFNKSSRLDPWDNHSDDPDNWAHDFIKDVEDENLHKDFNWLNTFVNNLKCNSIFGLSYGSWTKTIPWTTGIKQIVIHPTDKLFNFYYEIYERRPINVKELLISIQMHVHDHKQDNKEYNKHMMDNIYPKALEYAERGELEFWQLQSCFHHKGVSIPDRSEYKTIRNKIKQDITADYDFKYDSNAIVITDLFNISIKKLCKNLDIVYTNSMELEYNKFLNYVDKFIIED